MFYVNKEKAIYPKHTSLNGKDCAVQLSEVFNFLGIIYN